MLFQLFHLSCVLGRLTQTTSTGEAHFAPNCAIGFAYGIYERSCSKGSPLIAPPLCNPTAPVTENCIRQDDGAGPSGWTYFNYKTQDQSSYSTMTSAAVSAEGTGWGVSVSASVGYMQSHAYTSNAVSFWVGLSGDAYSEYYQNPSKLKLSSPGTDLLKKDWQEFLQIYGTHFVYKVIYATNFVGSAQLISTSEEHSSDLSVAASMSYSGFFTASGSASFQSKMEGAHNSLEMRVQAYYRGTLIKYAWSKGNPVKELQADFSAWQDDVRANTTENAVPTRLIYRSFLDLEDVQKTLLDHYNKTEVSVIQEAFYAELPSQETMDVLTQEYLWTKAQLNTLNRMATYPCVVSQNIQSQVQGYVNQLTTHLDEMQTMGGAEIILRQTQILQGDYSWFIGRNDVYTAKMKAILAKCPAGTSKCAGGFFTGAGHAELCQKNGFASATDEQCCIALYHLWCDEECAQYSCRKAGGFWIGNLNYDHCPYVCYMGPDRQISQPNPGWC